MRYGMGYGLDLFQKLHRFQICHDLLACSSSCKTTIRRGHLAVQRAVLVQDIDQQQLVALAELEIVEVVAGRDLDRA